jgi:CO/xanthine dehydrogenase Mo-binding subunit
MPVSPIGASVLRAEAMEKVTGRAEYADNVRLPNMVYGTFARSPVAHGVIRRVDTSAAQRVPGVVRVVTGAEVAAAVANPYYGPAFRDKPILAFEKVRYIGDPVAVVLAETAMAAREAAELVEAEYDELPPVFDVLDALEPDAPIIHEVMRPAKSFADLKNLVPRERSNLALHFKLRHGDVDAGFRQADRVFEDQFSTAAVQVAPMELLVSLASVQPNGKLTIWSATQSPMLVRSEVAYLLGIPESQIRVRVGYLGGGFGNKGYIKLEAVVAALAVMLRRPVKISLPIQDHMLTVTSQAAPVVRLRTGVTRDGRIVARQCEVYWDSGPYAEIGPRITQKSGFTAAGPYDIPNVHIDSYLVYTNNLPGEAIRGFGVPDVVWPGEVQLDIIAREMGWDPLTFRKQNVLTDGKVHATGTVMRAAGMKEVLDRLGEAMDWGKPFDHEVVVDGVRRRRGRGLAIGMKAVISPSLSSAIITMATDGSVTVFTSTIDMGQGAYTVMQQIAAEKLALPLDRVQLAGADTDVTPYDQLSGGSRSTFHMGNAILKAAEDLEAQLLDVAAREWSVPAAQLALREGAVVDPRDPSRTLPYPDVIQRLYGIPAGTLIGRGIYVSHYKPVDPETGQSDDITMYWFPGGNAVEVEVDPETGRIRVTKLVTVGEVGKALNPTNVRTQLSGGAIMRLGPTLYEGCRLENGQLVNGSLADYKVPTFLDVPDVVDTHYLEVPHPDGPFGAKGVGETGVFALSPAVAAAVHDAVGVWIKGLPITAEKVLRAIEERGTRR